MTNFHPRLNSLESREVPSAAIVAPTPSVVHSAAAESQSLKAAMEAIRAASGVPALAGGYIQDGEVITTATGFRQSGSPARVGANDQFHIGSNGKALTSTLVAILVEKRFISWNTTVGQAFPDLARQMNPAYRRVTLEQLLNHRGGFVDANVDPELFAQVIAFKGSASAARKVYIKEMLQTTPGNVGDYSYSNLGYTIASAMLERATGNTFEWLMQKYLFNPLGMRSAGFGPPGRGYGIIDQPRGHDATTGLSVGNGSDADNPPIMNAAGRIHMSMADWGKFLKVHLGETVNGKRILSTASLTKLHTADPRPTDTPGITYGFGWGHVMTPNGEILSHDGSNLFWYSRAVLIPSAHVAIFAATNQAGDAGQMLIDQASDLLIQRIV